MADTYCRDCLHSGRSNFHVMGLKCVRCGGYNTVREKGPLIRWNSTEGDCEQKNE